MDVKAVLKFLDDPLSMVDEPKYLDKKIGNSIIRINFKEFDYLHNVEWMLAVKLDIIKYYIDYHRINNVYSNRVKKDIYENFKVANDVPLHSISGHVKSRIESILKQGYSNRELSLDQLLNISHSFKRERPDIEGYLLKSIKNILQWYNKKEYNKNKKKNKGDDYYGY